MENWIKDAARYQQSVPACVSSIFSVYNPSTVTIEDHQIRFDYATPFTFSYKILSLSRLDIGNRHTPGKQPFSYPHFYISYVYFPVIFVVTFRELFELSRKVMTTPWIPFIEPWSFSVKCHLKWVRMMLTREFLFLVDSSIPHAPALLFCASNQTIHRVSYTSKQSSARWSLPRGYGWRFSGGRQRWAQWRAGRAASVSRIAD